MMLLGGGGQFGSIGQPLSLSPPPPPLGFHTHADRLCVCVCVYVFEGVGQQRWSHGGGRWCALCSNRVRSRCPCPARTCLQPAAMMLRVAMIVLFGAACVAAQDSECPFTGANNPCNFAGCDNVLEAGPSTECCTFVATYCSGSGSGDPGCASDLVTYLTGVCSGEETLTLYKYCTDYYDSSDSDCSGATVVGVCYTSVIACPSGSDVCELDSSSGQYTGKTCTVTDTALLEPTYTCQLSGETNACSLCLSGFAEGDFSEECCSAMYNYCNDVGCPVGSYELALKAYCQTLHPGVGGFQRVCTNYYLEQDCTGSTFIPESCSDTSIFGTDCPPDDCTNSDLGSVKTSCTIVPGDGGDGDDNDDDFCPFDPFADGSPCADDACTSSVPERACCTVVINYCTLVNPDDAGCSSTTVALYKQGCAALGVSCPFASTDSSSPCLKEACGGTNYNPSPACCGNMTKYCINQPEATGCSLTTFSACKPVCPFGGSVVGAESVCLGCLRSGLLGFEEKVPELCCTAVRLLCYDFGDNACKSDARLAQLLAACKPSFIKISTSIYLSGEGLTITAAEFEEACKTAYLLTGDSYCSVVSITPKTSRRRAVSGFEINYDVNTDMDEVDETEVEEMSNSVNSTTVADGFSSFFADKTGNPVTADTSQSKSSVSKPSAASASSSSSSSTGAIVGGVIGGVVLIAAVAALIIYRKNAAVKTVPNGDSRVIKNPGYAGNDAVTYDEPHH
eukprot:m.153010 g.153010  ORF g.153010 m.153010 type:complete len:735 (+) comp10171_c4_seq1:205-2409(+)